MNLNKCKVHCIVINKILMLCTKQILKFNTFTYQKVKKDTFTLESNKNTHQKDIINLVKFIKFVVETERETKRQREIDRQTDRDRERERESENMIHIGKENEKLISVLTD